MSFSPKALEAKDSIRALGPRQPALGIILGSGLGAIAEKINDPLVVPYSKIPHFPITTVEGHEGSMILGSLQGEGVIFLAGRFHAYEGYGLSQVTFPVEVLAALGVKDIFLTTAAGGLKEEFAPGDIMIVSDHLNLMGDNPLRGKHPPEGFVNLSAAYSSGWRLWAQKLANEKGIKTWSGVLAAVPGPSYETPAEVEMLRRLGADAVCMSTVPEAIMAKYLGMRVLALALITNSALRHQHENISHQEVLTKAREYGKRMEILIAELIKKRSEVSP